jgi:hypothetical protein
MRRIRFLPVAIGALAAGTVMLADAGIAQAQIYGEVATPNGYGYAPFPTYNAPAYPGPDYYGGQPYVAGPPYAARGPAVTGSVIRREPLTTGSVTTHRRTRQAERRLRQP